MIDVKKNQPPSSTCLGHVSRFDTEIELLSFFNAFSSYLCYIRLC